MKDLLRIVLMAALLPTYMLVPDEQVNAAKEKVAVKADGKSAGNSGAAGQEVAEEVAEKAAEEAAKKAAEESSRGLLDVIREFSAAELAVGLGGAIA